MNRRPPPPRHARAPARKGSSPRADAPDAPRDVPGVKNPYVRFRPLQRPPLEPFVTTLWDYPSQHYGKGEQGSSRYRGATPSWVIWQVVQRFTLEGARVVDPFCGSGTTLDVCRDLQRSARGFDVAPARADIEPADARSLPLDAASVDLVFMDPPYADNLRYSDDPRCIGRTRAEDGSYFSTMDAVFAEVRRVLRPGGHLAVYVQDILHPAEGAQGRPFFPLGIALAQRAQSRFRMVDHIAVMRRNHDLERGNHRQAALEQGFYLRGFNHLLLFQAPVAGSEAARPAKPHEARPSRGDARASGGPRHRPEGARGSGRGSRPRGGRS